MDVPVTPKTARENVLRVWLARVPESSGVFYAFHPHQDPEADEPLGEAHIYGRGAGSDAMERVMLIFHLRTAETMPQYSEGDTLRLLTRNKDGGFEDTALEIVEVE
ncbi:MAG: hypothetical protein AAF871_13845 [Pseudomonadota bacterium]